MLIVAAALLVACGGEAAGDGPPRVVASLYPLAWATEEIAGAAAEVANLTPPGVEPHDLELTPGQVRAVTEADVVLFVGGGFQPALEELARDHDAAVDVVAATSARDRDPHVWLDPLRMIEVAGAIRDELRAAAPDDAPGIKRRSAALVDELRTLHDDFGSALARCERREIVVSHAAFGYLAERYDLEQVAISGGDPEAEPSPGRIAQVAQLARAREASTIFFEKLVPPAIAETIAAEVGVETAVLDPLESPPEGGGYLDAMRENLAALQEALSCR